MEDQAIALLESRKNFAKERLEGQVVALRDHMNAVLRMLEEEDPIISSCGEVQGLGAAVDTRCAEFAILRSLLEEYHGRKAVIEEQAKGLKK